MENPGSHIMPDHVVDRVPGDRGYAQQEEEPIHPEPADGRQGAQAEKQGIAGQDRGDNQAGFTKNNYKYNEISPSTVILDEPDEMLIEMNENINEPEEQFHKRGPVQNPVKRRQYREAKGKCQPDY